MDIPLLPAKLEQIYVKDVSGGEILGNITTFNIESFLSLFTRTNGMDDNDGNGFDDDNETKEERMDHYIVP